METNGREFGIRRTKRLPVSGAFHTKIMKPAKENFSKVCIVQFTHMSSLLIPMDIIKHSELSTYDVSVSILITIQCNVSLLKTGLYFEM